MKDLTEYVSHTQHMIYVINLISKLHFQILCRIKSSIQVLREIEFVRRICRDAVFTSVFLCEY